MAGIYWVGSNGNVYYKTSAGVVDAGKLIKSYGNKGFDAARMSAEASQIADPNPGGTQRQQQQQQQPNNNTLPTSQSLSVGGGGGGAAPAPVGPTQEQIAPILASLSSLDGILRNKDAQSQAEYDRAMAGYNSQDAIDRAAYQESVTGNEKAYTANNQASLLNAANSYGGLRGALSSMGALAGSGLNVVKRLVGLAANQDTGNSRQNFETNAGTINTNWSKAEQQQRQRREDANATLENNKQNNKASILTSRQSMLQQLAQMYGPEMAQGKKYAAEAASLAAPIAATTRAAVAPYQAASSSYTPAALQKYLAGTQNLNVNTSAGGGESVTPINSPLFGKDKKDQLPGVA